MEFNSNGGNMPDKKELVVEHWEPDSEAYDLLAKFLVKKFIVKEETKK